MSPSVPEMETYSKPQAPLTGELDSHDNDGLVQYLAGLGISYTANNLDSEKAYTIEQKFEDIVHPQTFIIKEAFENFHTSLHPEMRLATLATVFSNFVDIRRQMFGYGWSEESRRAEYTPEPFPGIILKSRVELGIPEYADLPAATGYFKAAYTLRYAIQADSIINTVRPLTLVRASNRDRLTKTEHIMLSLADKLTDQFNDHA